MAKNFSNLVEMQEMACQKYAHQELYGTKYPDGYRWITFGEYGDMVNAMRSGLKSLGVQRGDKVAIIARNCVEWSVTAYASYSLMAQYVPMYESQQSDEWKYIVQDCGAKVLFVATADIYEQVKKWTDDIPHLKSIISLGLEQKSLPSPSQLQNSYRDLLKYGQTHPVPSEKPESSWPMGLVYTSGTTGQPKGVILTHGNILSNLNVIPSVVDLSGEDRTLAFLPWAHIFGQVAEVHAPLFSGFSCGIAESVTTIVDNLSEIHPTLLFSVPRVFNRIYDGVNAKMKDAPAPIRWLFETGIKLSNKKRDYGPLSTMEHILLEVANRIVFEKIRQRFGGRLRVAVSGASALNIEVAKFIDNLGINILEGYGLSETSPLISVNTIQARKLGSVGKIIKDVRVVIDKTVLGDAVSESQDGEIVVYGPNVMVGYHNLADETQKVFTKDKGFRTGDLGHLDEEGYLFITGRIKEQYKLENGKYVVPTIIEDSLKLSPYINQAFLYGTNKPYNVVLLGVDMPVLLKWASKMGITPKGGQLCDHPAVKELFQKEMEAFSKVAKEYEKPKKFSLVQDEWTIENGLMTPSMKIKRASIYNRYQNTIDFLYQ